MRNLTYRETAVCFTLIAALCGAAYQTWFAPALAQTERDHRETQRILAMLSKARHHQAPQLAASTLLPVPPAPSPAFISTSPKTKSPMRRHKLPSVTRGKPVLEVKCADESDPLCGALD